MSIIQLPKSVYEKLKAGEVIEDPASIVRELLDNSIDAMANSIEVSITNGGMDSITIKDNGLGMPLEDLNLCYLPHTTSKIKEFNDIFNLNTAGFRGEALASVCQIAQVSISSSTKQMDLTHTIEVSEGKITNTAQGAPLVGTTIKVKNIFYNVPVRKGFLKSKGRESSKIKKEVILKALAHPEIAFKLTVDGSVSLICPKNDLIEERITSLIKIAPPLYPIAYKEEDFSIKGIITGIDQVFDSAQNLYFFINNRPLVSKSFYGVLWRSLSNLIPRGKYLGGCIYIYTAPKNIDPNIHPSKREVKIFVENVILQRLYSLVRNTFYNKSYATFLDLKQQPELESKSPSLNKSPEHNNPLFTPNPFFQTSDFSVNELNQNSPLFFRTDNTNPPFNPVQNTTFEKSVPYLYLGTAFETYWIVQKNEEIYFIDFHAAHERKRYEDLLEKTNTKTPESQLLLEPLIYPLGADEMNVVEESLESLNELGFDISFIGENVLSIKAIPAFYKENNMWQKDFELFINDYKNITFKKSDFKDYLLKNQACRYSYMSHDFVSKNEIYYLLNDIFANRFPLTCPHGRPFIFTLPKKQLESQFLRK